MRPPSWSRWPRWLKITLPGAVLLAFVAVGQFAAAPSVASPSSTTEPSPDPSGESSTSGSTAATTEATTPTTTTPTTTTPTTTTPTAATTAPGVTTTTPAATTTVAAPATTTAPAPDPAGALTAALAAIVVQRENSGAGYDRDLFGYPDVRDAAGCNTRARVLKRDSTTFPQVDPFGCTVVAGDWYSLYDGLWLTDPGDVQIDHVVALKEAWESGAASWSGDRLVAFGNDVDGPGSLRAVSATSNQSKSDRDAWCAYIADWVGVKARWGLTMDPREHGVVTGLVVACGGRAPAVVPTAPAPGPVPTPSTAASPTGELYVANCTAARAAGIAPIYRGQPGYRAALDRDDDGIACE